MNYLFYLLLILSSFSIQAATFDDWKLELKKTLQKSKINQSTVDIFIKHAQYDQVVQDTYTLQRKPLPLPLDKFLNQWFQSEDISKSWIATEGKKLLKENQVLLRRIEKKYRVDKNVIVALWGIESKYGKLTGKYPVLNSLSTLAYSSQRKDFYTNELIHALKIIQKNKMNPDQFLGSWAGAIGQCQFMPSNYFVYGVDFDKNKKVDLFNSLPDIFASIANYLNKSKWKYKRPVGHRVILPAEFKPKYLTYKSKNNSFWNKLKIRDHYQKKLPRLKDKSHIVSVIMADTNYLVVYKNFDVILRWNRSYLFGLKVILLKTALEE
ncbi:MAG: hypothetical protein A2202_05295 [Bdellovibrionales bacterium RIFOXYA1_FULL_36_14]|nr:MAG: hypothetical protein A2202_05295 [Bdellovibrionales bacterium RIFOXYA1_FULL_36_14]